MTGNEYQKLAMRTNDGMSSARLEHLLRFYRQDDITIGDLLNGCLGLSGEVGELLDEVKKWLFHEKPLDEDHLKKELGDVFWYGALFCYAMDWDLDEILQMNIDKLKARYPEGFSPDRSNHRAEGDV